MARSTRSRCNEYARVTIGNRSGEFLKITQKAAWKNTPMLKRRTMGNNYSNEIRELIAEKRRARKR
jgi:hypothetical protein